MVKRIEVVSCKGLRTLFKESEYDFRRRLMRHNEKILQGESGLYRPWRCRDENGDRVYKWDRWGPSEVIRGDSL